MTAFVNHDLKLSLSRDEESEQGFVSALRAHVLGPMADSLKQRWTHKLAPTANCTTAEDVHTHIRTDPYFRFYSATRVLAQELVWSSVHAPLKRSRRALQAKACALQSRPGTLKLNADLPMPDNVTSVDVHLMPGNYHHESGADDLTAGALYDNGLSVFSFGLMGDTLDDIGRSITTYVQARWPDFNPARILDLGCTIGHQTCPWKQAYPQAVVTGIDVAAPSLRYAHARAQSLGYDVAFEQRDARRTGYESGSFDLIFSSMFLHELPVADIKAVFCEAKRLLRPGGLMLHYELPPNDAMSAYDGFYLDWDSAYNNEPWYKGFRDQKPQALCAEAGFLADSYVQFVTPSLGGAGAAAIVQAACGAGGMIEDDHTGRLAEGVQWFAFGAWA
jgi:ubiquinone/menaquinone biosynthesis C-methylase UbiE